MRVPGLKRAARIGGTVLLTLVALVLGGLLALQVDPVGTRVARAVVSRVTPGWLHLEFRRVSGSWLRSLTVVGLQAEDLRTGSSARVDTLYLRYRPLSWTLKRVALDSVFVANPSITVHPPDTGVALDTSQAEPRDFVLQVHALDLSGGTGRVEYGDSQRFQIDSLRVGLRNLRVGSELGVAGWTVRSRFAPSGTEAGWGRLGASGSLVDATLSLDSLSATSPRSRVSGSAHLPLDSTVVRPGAVRWDLEAAPLALADLQGLVRIPAGAEGDSVFLTTRASQVGDSAVVGVSLHTASGADGNLEFRWGGGPGSWSGELRAEVLGVALSRFLGEGVPSEPASLTLEGDVQLQSSAGELSALRSKAWVGASAGPSVVRGTFTLRRDLLAEDAYRDSVGLSLDTLAWKGLSLRASHAALVRQGAEVDWEVALRPVGGGDLTGTGWLRGFGDLDPLVYRGDFAARSLAEPMSGSLLTGVVRLEGRGSTIADAAVDGEVHLESSSVATVELDSAALHFSWDGGQGRFRAAASGPPGRLRLVATAAIAEDRGRVVVESMVMDSLRPLFQTESAPPIQVSGELTGEAEWPGGAVLPDPELLTAQVALRTWSGVLGTVALDSAHATATWTGGEVVLVGRGHLPGDATLDLAAEGTLLDSLAIRLSRGRFRSVSPQALGLAGPLASLNGEVTGTARRAAGDTAVNLSVDLVLEPSALGGDTIRGLIAQAEVTRDLIDGSFAAELGGGTVTGSVQADRLLEGHRWRGSVNADLPRVGGFFGQPDTAVSLVGRGVLTTQGDDGAPAVALEIHRASGWGARLDTLVASAHLDEGLLVLDTLSARSNVATLSGAGRVPVAVLRTPDVPGSTSAADSVTHQLRLEAVLPDSMEALELPGLGPTIARAGSLGVELDCSTRQCEVAGGGGASSLSLGRNAVGSAQVEVTGVLEPGFEVVDLRAGLTLEGIRTSTAQIRGARLDAVMQDQRLAMDVSAVIDDLRDADLGLDADLRQDQREITVRRLRFRMGQEPWELSRPTTMRYGAPGWVLDTLEVAAGRQRLLATGTWAGPDGHSFALLVDSIRVGGFADLVGTPGLDGWLSGTVDGFGSDPMPYFEASARGSLSYRDRATHHLRLQADHGPGFLAVDARVMDSTNRHGLRLAGEIPLGEESGTEWSLQVLADSLPLAWLEPYLPSENVRGVRGTAAARLVIRGERSRPTARGPLWVDGGHAVLPGLGIALEQVRLRASVEGQTLTVDSLWARSGGWARIAGSVTLPSLSEPASLGLDLTANGFQAINTRLVRSVVGGRLTLGGTTVSPDVRGSIDVSEAEIRLDAGLGGASVEDVTLTDEDWAMLQDRFGIPRPEEEPPTRAAVFLQTALEVSVALGRDIWLRQRVNPEMAVQFTGDVAVRKAVGEETVRMEGRLEAIPRRSYLEQFGRRFRLEEGTVLLRGAPEDTRVEITSVYEVPPRDGDASQVQIRLGLVGEVGRLELTLGSEPAMSNNDIISYLATGRPSSEAFSGDGGESSFTEIGAGVVASRLTGMVEDFAMRDVGLDVVEIQRDGLRGAVLVAGRYVTPTLFLGFRQPVSFGQVDASRDRTGATEAEVEWRALRWLMLNLETGGSAFRFFLEGSFGY